MAIQTLVVSGEPSVALETRPIPEVVLKAVAGSVSTLTEILTQRGEGSQLQALVLKSEPTSSHLSKLLLQLTSPKEAATSSPTLPKEAVTFSIEVTTPESLPVGSKLLLSLLKSKDGEPQLELLKTIESKGIIPSNISTKSEVGFPAMTQATQNIIQNLFQQIFKANSPDITLESLRQLNNSSNKVPASFLAEKALASFKEILGKPKPDFQKLFLQEESFKSPEKLATFLKSFAGNSPITGEELKKAAILQQEITSSAITEDKPLNIDKLTKSLQDFKQIANNIRDSAATAERATEQLPSTRIIALIQQIDSFISSPDRFLGLNSGLDRNALLKQIIELKDGLLDFSKKGNNSGKESTENHVKHISNQLEKLLTLISRSSRITNAEQSIMTQGSAVFLGSAKNSSATKKLTKGSGEAAKLLENFIQGQEALRRLNPLMQQMGEPMFLLIPGFLQGFLQNLEIRFFPPDHIDNERKKKLEPHGEYHRMALSFKFPSIGKVRIDVAHRGHHLLMSFSSENEEVVDFLDEHLYLLRKPLNELGFTSQELLTRKALPKQPSIKPKWFEELLGIKTVA